MRNAILELKSIGYGDDRISVLIGDWLEKHVGQKHWLIRISPPENPEAREYYIKKAMHELGKEIAENANMFPTFHPIGRDMECRISALYFKNEYGK